MRYLVLSDIHSNWEALEAVLADAQGLYQQTVCLGDIVGYGPDPNRVTDWVRENCAVTIRGNHDRASVDTREASLFNPVARAAAEWTEGALEERHKAYLRALPQGPASVDGFDLVHGAPGAEDAYIISSADADLRFGVSESDLVFFGHTHLQGGFKRSRESSEVQELGTERILSIADSDEYLVNPGSVGQPRDDDWRAAYAIYDSKTREVEYRRCVYDVDATQRKIVDADLPFLLAERLALGR